MTIALENLNKIITKTHNYLYANEGLSNAESLEELLKLMYCKILIERQYKEKLNSSDDHIYELVNSIYSRLSLDFADIFESTLKVKKETICYIMKMFLEINFSSIRSDAKGHILQKVMDRSYRERNGQFFTPIPVVDFIVKMINPKSFELGCDPACGTGGFMFSALNYIMDNENINSLNNLYFYEISDKITRFIKMRTMFEYENCNANIKTMDSLSNNFECEFDYVLSNPPFGSQGKITNSKLLSQYELGRDKKKNKVLSNQVPDILFVEKIIKSLRYGGRAAIVLPDGDLENPSNVYLREYILDNVKIDSIISLPNGTFIPYGTGVKVSILFLTKLKKDELSNLRKNDYKIFFSKINKLGYTFSKHSKEDLNSDGTICQDYESVISAYKNKIYDDVSFLTPLSNIIKKKTFSYSFYCPIYNNLIDKITKGEHILIKDAVELVEKKEFLIPDKEYSYIEIADVNASSNEIFNSEKMLGEELPSRASYIVKTGNIIVAVAGNAIGSKKHSKAFVTEEYNDCICTNGFLVMKPKKISAYYLLYFFNSIDFLNQIKKYKYGSAIPTISKDDFLNIAIPLYGREKMNQIETAMQKACEYRNKAKSLVSFDYSSVS